MTRTMNLLHNIVAIIAFMVFTIIIVPGCTSEPKRVQIPAAANVTEEMANLGHDLNTAEESGVNILSPRNFEKAQDHFSKAKKEQEKGKDSGTIFKAVGMAKAYLILANEQAERIRSSAVGILSARNDAISAGAEQSLPKQFEKAEHELEKATYDAERTRSDIKASERAGLQKNYLELQIDTIKAVHLAPAEKLIQAAKKNGARRYAPTTLATAEAKLQQAMNIIETDRSNAVLIRVYAIAARREANKLYNVTETAKSNNTSEKVALELNARRVANEQMSEELSSAEALLARQRLQTKDMETENVKLERENKFNESLAWAQKQFSVSDAEVYRQGDKLVIRLKNMNYNPGQTQLSAAAYPSLNKVKEIIDRIGAQAVVVEGHTDSIGSEIINKNVSQARAEEVAAYLKQGKSVSKNQIEAEGYGFEKPLTTNRTPAGRAQNRRVDIIVTPEIISE